MEYQTQTVSKQEAAELVELYQRRGTKVDVHYSGEEALIIVHQNGKPKRYTHHLYRRNH